MEAIILDIETPCVRFISTQTENYFRYYRQSESQQEQKILFLDLNIFDNKIFCDKDACAVGDEMIGRSDIY